MRKRTVSMAAFLAVMLLLGVLTGGQAADAANITPDKTTVLYGQRVSPYLLPDADGDGVLLRWVAESDQPVTVYYGPRTEQGVDLAQCKTVRPTPERAEYSRYYDETWYFAAELTLPESGYAYALAEAGKEPAVWYDIAGENDGVLSVFFTSDSHVCNDKHAAPMGKILDDLSKQTEPELICHTGDVNENSRFGPNILIRAVENFRSVPVAAVCGNHDSLEAFYEFFRMENLVEELPGGVYNSQLLDYSFLKENVLFIGLNMRCGDIQSHGDYVRRAVAENPDAAWTVVMIHYSFFSNGSHGRDATLKHFQEQLCEVFAETDVDLVVSGHDHEYDRSLLYAGAEPVPGTDGNGVKKADGETVYVSLPTATGTKFYSKVTYINAEPAAEALKEEPGYVLAKFSQQSIVLRAYTAAGNMVDSLVLTHK